MARKDYDQIKMKTNQFLKLWKTGETDGLENIVAADALVYLSTVKGTADGSQHSRYGVANFILDTPKPDVFHMTCCNYVCRLKEDNAQQSFVAVAHAVKIEGEDVKAFEFSAFFNNSWKRQEDDWKITEMRMDIVDYNGDYKEFMDCWYYEDPKAKWYPGIHLPVIQGEMDSPWVRIPDAEDILTDEEKCMEQFCRYAYGIDTIACKHVYDAFDEDILIDMAPWGIMNKRGYLTSIKYHRTKSRYWTHTARPSKVEIDGNICKMTLPRLAGHRPKEHGLVVTKENMNHEFSCATYEVELKKRNDIWMITKMGYYQGIVDLGEYED